MLVLGMVLRFNHQGKLYHAFLSGRIVPGCQWCYCVEIKPVVVATIQRPPQRVIETIRPTPGT